MAKVKTKRAAGLEATSKDGIVWEWEAGEFRWSWCPAGQVRRHARNDGPQAIVLWCKSVEIALAYVSGWTYGYSLGKAEVIDVVAETKEPGSPA